MIDETALQEEIDAAHAAGNHHRLAELVMTHYEDQIFGFMINLCRDRQVAEEVLWGGFAQKVVLAMPGFRNPRAGALRAWAFQVARTTVFDYFKNPRDPIFTTIWDKDPVPLPKSTYRQTETKRYFRKLLAELGDEDREIVELRGLLEFSAIETAQILHGGPFRDADEQTTHAARIRKRYQRAINKLETEFRAAGFIRDESSD